MDEQLKKINHIYIDDFFFMKKSRGLHEINRGGMKPGNFITKLVVVSYANFFKNFSINYTFIKLVLI
jgi:hypothetical protein